MTSKHEPFPRIDGMGRADLEQEVRFSRRIITEMRGLLEKVRSTPCTNECPCALCGVLSETEKYQKAGG